VVARPEHPERAARLEGRAVEGLAARSGRLERSARSTGSVTGIGYGERHRVLPIDEGSPRLAAAWIGSWS
jgi:hypothetical protein